MKKTIFYFIFLIFSIASFAQTNVVTRDFETWSSVAIKAKFGKKWSLNIEEQIRLQENSSVMDEYFTGANIKYTLIEDHLKLGSGYRFINDYDVETGYDKEQRFNFDITYMHTFNRLELSTRLRYQNRNDIGEKIIDGDYPRQHYRLKIEAEYKIKNWKFDPIVGVELFRRNEKYTLPYYDKLRFRIGTDFKIKDYGKLDVFYQIDYGLGTAYPQTTYVLGVNYRYSFGNILKKKTRQR